ncbi:MAG: mechanosensitive ion channel [Deltaproteobacteria bacterium]|nr:mechanosensitive ion channel [Deltaproteobacteria bacterium]
MSVATLNALQLEAITAPASLVLLSFLSALPALFGATLLIALAYFAARLLSGVVTQLLQGAGFDDILARIGLAKVRLGKRTPSGLVGGLVLVSVLLFAFIEAAQMIGFDDVADFGSEFVFLGGHLLLGLAIFGVGVFLANLGARAVKQSGLANGASLSTMTRSAVLILAGAMALRQMGIADAIIELAFGITFGAVAIAAALAFGLGGREAASKALEDLRDRLKARSNPPRPARARPEQAA